MSAYLMKARNKHSHISSGDLRGHDCRRPRNDGDNVRMMTFVKVMQTSPVQARVIVVYGVLYGAS